MDKKIVIYLLTFIAVTVLVIGGIQVKQYYVQQKAEAETRKIMEKEAQELQKWKNKSWDDLKKESGTPNFR